MATGGEGEEAERRAEAEVPLEQGNRHGCGPRSETCKPSPMDCRSGGHGVRIASAKEGSHEHMGMAASGSSVMGYPSPCGVRTEDVRHRR